MTAIVRQSPLLIVEHLSTAFTLPGRPRQTLRAVDDVSFTLDAGQTLGLLGESGCGKSTLARTILGLVPAAGGRVRFDGHDLLGRSARQMRPLRRHIQIIFQDPVGSLNPRLNIETIVGEGLSVHRLVRSAAERRQIVAGLLERVGLRGSDMHRYPHEFSGGQRQRIGIARALAVRPKLVICDEPVSALDVSIQSQILNLLADLQEEFGLAYLFIAHDLAVVRHFCDIVAVMYLGRIVERAPTEELVNHATHPYTQALLRAAPRADPTARQRPTPLPGEVPDAATPPAGCPFHPRCAEAQPSCRRDRPRLIPLENATDHLIACPIAPRPQRPDPAPTSRRRT